MSCVGIVNARFSPELRRLYKDLRKHLVVIATRILASVVIVSGVISTVIKVLLGVVIPTFILILFVLIIDLFFHSLVFVIDIPLGNNSSLVVFTITVLVKVF